MDEPENTQPGPRGPVAELNRTIEVMLEHSRKGYDIMSLLFHAQKLTGQLADSPASVAAVAGYQMKGNPRVFYPADWRPTDIDNFDTLVYAGDVPEPVEPHYVLRYDDPVDGPLGKTHGLVSVRDWNAGMSRAVSERVCDSNGQPLVVYPRPQAMVPAAIAEASPCS
jgi:hypothetical protein